MDFFPNEMKMYGNKLFLWSSRIGLDILDISSPGNPSRLSRLNETAMFYTMAVSNHYAYLFGYGIKIFDISNPASPVFTAYTSGGGSNAILSGNFIYILSGGFGIYDISVPTEPKDIFQTDKYDYDDSFSLSVSGNNLYISDTDEGFDSYDVSDPYHPVLGGSQISGILPYGLYHSAKGKYLYIKNDSTLYIFDTSTRPYATQLSTYGVYGTRIYPDASSRYLYIVNGASIRIIDIANLTNPKEVGLINIGM
jgi:hypothetical protein